MIQHVTLDQAKAAGAQERGATPPLLRHGAMRARYLEPELESDPESSDQDSIYIVADGYGALQSGEALSHVAPGDLLFVPAGEPHRFVDVTVGLAIWVIRYGPDGGDAGR